MIVLSSSVEQTVQPGQSVVFDTVVQKTGCAECHRNNTGTVMLRDKGGTYEVHFSGNVGSETAATPVQLALALSAAPLAETTMISTPAAVGELNSVSTATLLKNCCCECERVSVMNNGVNPVVLGANSSLFVKRVG